MTKKPKSDLAKQLITLRGPFTQAEAAAKIGVSPSTWIAWENGTRTPGRFAKQRLLDVFKLKI